MVCPLPMHRIFLESWLCGKQECQARAPVHAAHNSARAPRASNSNNLKSKRKYQSLFTLQEFAESKDRILI